MDAAQPTITAELMPVAGPSGTTYFVDTRQGRFPVEFINGFAYITPKGYPPIRVVQPTPSGASPFGSFPQPGDLRLSKPPEVLDPNIAALQATVMVLQTSVASLMAQLEAKSKEIGDLRAELATLQNVVFKLNSQVTQQSHLVDYIDLFRAEVYRQVQPAQYASTDSGIANSTSTGLGNTTISGSSFFPGINSIRSNVLSYAASDIGTMRTGLLSGNFGSASSISLPSARAWIASNGYINSPTASGVFYGQSQRPLDTSEAFLDPIPNQLGAPGSVGFNAPSLDGLARNEYVGASEPIVPLVGRPEASTSKLPEINVSSASAPREDLVATASSKLLYSQGPSDGQFKRPVPGEPISGMPASNPNNVNHPFSVPSSTSEPAPIENNPKSTLSGQEKSIIEIAQNMTRADVEKWLVERGFPLGQGGLKDAATTEGMRAIHFACHYGNVAAVDFLLNNGFATIHDRTTQEFTPLLRACRSGQLQIVRYLLARGSKVDEKDSYGDTALLSAAMHGHLPVIQYLLEHGSSLKERSTGLHSAVIRAAMNGKISVVKWLLENGSNAQEADKDGYTPLLCAALHGYVDLVKYLLSPPARSSITETSRSGNTAFLCAARDGHLEVIKFLVTLDPNLRNHSDRRGTTVLMRAAANGHLLLVEWILENFPDAVDDKDYEEDSPLSFASMAGHARVVHYLLHPPKGTRGAEINARNKLRYTPLIRSAMNGKKEVADLLLKEGADLTLADKDGFTAVLCAALHGYLPVLESLVAEAKKRYGTEAIPKLRDMKTNAGRSLMICAGRNGHTKIMEYLLENDLGAVGDKDAEEDTALICAAMNDHVDAVQWLIEKGASAIQPNKDGHTALIRAAMNGRLRTVRWLLDDGIKFMKEGEKPKITDTDRDGYTATICAALHGHLELLKYLVNTKKASLSERTKSGQTALLCAARNGKLEVVKWLLDSGAELGVKDLSENTVLDCARRSNNFPLISFLDKALAPPGASSSNTIGRYAVPNPSGYP